MIRSGRGVLAVFLAWGLTLASVPAGSAQQSDVVARDVEERAVIAAAQALFDAMEALDAEAFRNSMVPEGSLLAVGLETTRRTTRDDFAARIAEQTRPMIERMWDPDVRIDGPVATLWAPYDFHSGPEFSHCGTDAFQLAKTPEGWKVVIVTYTAQIPPTCNTHPEGPPRGAQDRDVSLAGAIDFHVHSGPDSRPRSVNDLEVARMTARAGLRGIVLKNHFTITSDRAALAMAQVDGLEVFGGVVLNRAVGGLNAEAVRQMVQFSGDRGKVVWLPTFDAEWYVTAQGGSGPFVSVTRNGEPLPELVEIFSLVAEHDLVLAMGHSAPEEVLVLIPEARRHGVERILVTHVFSQNPSRAQMQEMADAGAILEIDWYAVHLGNQSLDTYVSAIQEIGAEHFLMSSDLGQATSPSHVEGLRAYVAALRGAGVTDDQIDLMLRRNPARLLGLEP